MITSGFIAVWREETQSSLVDEIKYKASKHIALVPRLAGQIARREQFRLSH
jgi:hypothetical protein